MFVSFANYPFTRARADGFLRCPYSRHGRTMQDISISQTSRMNSPQSWMTLKREGHVKNHRIIITCTFCYLLPASKTSGVTDGANFLLSASPNRIAADGNITIPSSTVPILRSATEELREKRLAVRPA